MAGSVIGFNSMLLGFPGTISRNDLNYTRAFPVRPTDATPLSFGDVTVKVAQAAGNAVITSVANFILGGGTLTAALVSGIAVRQARQASQYFNQATVFGFSAGMMGEYLERGTISVKCVAGTPAVDGAVYVRTAVNTTASPNGVVGSIEAAPDGSNSILIPNWKWETGLLDANSVAELTILYRTAT